VHKIAVQFHGQNVCYTRLLDGRRP